MALRNLVAALLISIQATAVADPVDDIRPTAAYRGRLVGGVLVRELSDRLGVEFRADARRGRR